MATPFKRIVPLPWIHFSNNWNGKLNCEFFTTIRLKKDKYVPGRRYEIYLRDTLAFEATIYDIKQIRLADITEYVARTDMGLTGYDCRQFFREQYADKNINWDTQILQYILLRKN